MQTTDVESDRKSEYMEVDAGTTSVEKPAPEGSGNSAGSKSWQDRAFEYVTNETDYVQAFRTSGLLKDEAFVILITGAVLSHFLTQCLDPNMTDINNQLRTKDACMKELNKLDSDTFNDLVARMSDVFVLELGDPESWKEKLVHLFKHPVFRPDTRSRPTTLLERSVLEPQAQAMMAAWEVPFESTIHDELWQHIQGLMRQNENRYANSCDIIQSSGSGKSRMVDQLGTEHFVINICLREDGTSGFPPADKTVRDYLVDADDEYHDSDYAKRRMDAFLEALFIVTNDEVNRLVGELPPSDNKYLALLRKFRLLMTENQRFDSPNKYRRDFYSRVIKQAEANLELAKYDRTISACKALCGVLECLAKREEDIHPIAIIAFDESATLTQYPAGKNKRIPPPLSILLNRLSFLTSCSLFSLFLSTMGRTATVSSKYVLPDRSARLIKGEEHLNPAFTGCIFDRFALGSHEGTLTINEVAGDWYMMHLGRPLWATRVDNKNTDQETRLDMRRNAMEFAVGKLLNWHKIRHFSKWRFEIMEVVACLAVRLPIEFHSTAYSFQKPLVENHMRICLRLDPEHESMLSMSVSEPVLSEAAFTVMRHDECNVLTALAWVLGGSVVHKGDRGELLALLILILARDQLVANLNEDAMWKTAGMLRLTKKHITDDMGRVHVEECLEEWDRVFSVPQFIRSLFNGLDQSILDGIDMDFAGTYMHFNHFVKGYEQGLLKTRFLMALLTRGAGLLCANSPESVDVALAYIKGPVIEHSKTGLFLVQVRNSPKYKDKPHWSVNADMDPVALGIVSEDNILPVIRVVFALASSKSAVHARRVQVKSSGRSYIAYDIWCAGLDTQCLKPVGAGSSTEALWKLLLDATQPWKDNYTLPGEKKVKEHLQLMTPGMGLARPFWNFFSDVTSSDDELESGPSEPTNREYAMVAHEPEEQVMVEEKERPKRKRQTATKRGAKRRRASRK